MKAHIFSHIKIALLFCLLVLLFTEKRATPVYATVELQNSCEDACVCDGYTVDKLQYEDEHRILSETFKPINSKCVYEYFFWLQRNGGGGNVSDTRAVYQNFLDEWQKWCDDCRGKLPGIAPTDTPTPISVPELEEPSNGDGGDNGGLEESTPCEPYTKMGDLDCDGIPDNDDLCLYTPGTADRCGCGTLIAGDLLFRSGLASWITTGFFGDYDFGHVAMYTGDIVVPVQVQNRHKYGVTSLIYNPEKQRFISRSYTKPYIAAYTILIDSIIEADKGYGGVGISDRTNLYSDHKGFDDNLDNIAFGRPYLPISCSQRRKAITEMLSLAKLTDEGNAPYWLLDGRNCANYVLIVYRSALGEPEYLDYLDKSFLASKGIWPLSPNYLASQLEMYEIGNGMRIKEDSLEDPPAHKISVGMLPSSPGRRYFIPYDSNISWSLNSPVIQNKSSSSGKPLLSVYDAQGNFTGETITDIVVNIPGSEIFAQENEPTIINVYGHDSLLVQVNVDSPTGFELAIYGEDYPSPKSTIKILYPETQFESNTIMQVELQPSALDPEALGLYIYRNGADYTEEVILPTVEIGQIQYDVQVDEPEYYNPVSETPSSIAGNWFLWGAIPGVLCFGASFIVLIAGVFTKNKKISTLGIILIAVVICASVVAAAYFTGSQLMSSEPANPLDSAPMIPPPQQEIPFSDLQPTVFVPADIAPTLAPVVPTIVPSEEPHSQEVYPEPTVYNFTTCPSPCLGDLSNRQSIFPEKTERLYLRFNYDWITPGSDYVRLWKNGGQEWVRYQCKWDGPESGVFETDLREPAGFRSGEWTMETYVNGQLVAQNSFTVQGNYSYWYPAGTIYKCK